MARNGKTGIQEQHPDLDPELPAGQETEPQAVDQNSEIEKLRA